MRYPNAGNWNRRRRVETLGVTAARGNALRRRNLSLREKGVEIHPTKGFRRRAITDSRPRTVAKGLGALSSLLFGGKFR